MIHGKLETLKNYKGFNKDFDDVIDYVLTHDLEALPVGKTEINSKTVITKLVYMGKEKVSPELHRNHLDLQIVLHGREKTLFDEYNSAVDDKALAPWDSVKDVIKFDCELRNQMVMDNTNFSLFTPTDLHAPSYKIDDEEITKLVIKTEL